MGAAEGGYGEGVGSDGATEDGSGLGVGTGEASEGWHGREVIGTWE